MPIKDLTKEQLLNFLKENKQYLKNVFHISEIGIFGSFARGEENAKSDIDLVVEFDKNVDNMYEIKCALRDFFQKKFGRETDIARKKFLKSRVKNQILKETIYV